MMLGYSGTQTEPRLHAGRGGLPRAPKPCRKEPSAAAIEKPSTSCAFRHRVYLHDFLLLLNLENSLKDDAWSDIHNN